MAAAAAAAAAAALRSLGSRVKVNKRPIAFVQSKFSKSWENLSERVRSLIIEQFVKSAVVTVWVAGVLTVSTTLDRLGVIDTGLSNNTMKQKEHISAAVKVECDKTFELLRNQHGEDKAHLKKISEEFEAHRAITRLWLSHLIGKSMDPLSTQDISNIQAAFAIVDKGDGMITLEEARSIMMKFGGNLSESHLQQMFAEKEKISLPELVTFIFEKVKELPSEPSISERAKVLPEST